jgi:hypothetical protein
MDEEAEPNFSLVEKGLSTWQVVVVPIDFGLHQVEGIGESSGRPCKAYTETSCFSFHFFPRQHYLQPSYPHYPCCF